jgi:hypothetical protein
MEMELDLVSNWTSSKFLVKGIKGSKDLKNKKEKEMS